MEEAFASDRPVIIDAVTTPDEAPSASPHHLRTGEGSDKIVGRGSRGWNRRGEGSDDGETSRSSPESTLMRVSTALSPVRGAASDVEHFIDAVFVNVAHGRFERSLSGLTAIAALITSDGDLHRALSRQFRQQGDVESHPRHAAARHRGRRGGLLQTLGEDGCCRRRRWCTD